MKKIYGYARLSRDEDRKNYGSIETQINLINEYSQKTFGKNPNKIFIDDDVSGYIPIADRPDFYELYTIVTEAKEKPIVLMKDWSRLSRNNGIAQSILNEWKTNNVELILVKEMGAPFNILTDNDDIVGITTWVNERYVKETSRKVRDALHDRLKAGIVIQGPRYGYIKGKNGTLTVNEEVREAVKTIFDLYEEGYGMTSICRKLNLEYDFKNPSILEAERFKRDNEEHRDIRRSVREYWEADMENKILRDETYTGTLVTHKKERQGIHGKKVKILAKEENYRFPNHHEAIISKEQFDRVQEKLKKRSESSGWYKKGKNYYIFSGFIRCGVCEAAGTGNKDKGILKYECLNHARYGNIRCTCKSVREDYMLENFKIFLKKLGEEYKDILKEMKLEDIKKMAKTNQERATIKLDKAKQEYKIMQRQKVKEMASARSEEEKTVIAETYSELIEQKLQEITELTKTLSSLSTQTNKRKRENLKQAINYFDEIIKSETPSKEVLSQILEQIVINQDKSLRFELKMSIERLI